MRRGETSARQIPYLPWSRRHIMGLQGGESGEGLVVRAPDRRPEARVVGQFELEWVSLSLSRPWLVRHQHQ
jgi:hypothetical protein